MSVATLHPPPMLPAAEAWRCGRCVSWQERPLLTLSWALAVASASLAIGLVGLATPVEQPIHLLSYVPAPEGEEQGETALFELAAPLSGLEESLPSEPDTAAELEVADFLPEVVLPPLDLPELVEVLTQEAVFEVPAAPQVESALTPNEPTPPKPSEGKAAYSTARPLTMAPDRVAAATAASSAAVAPNR